MSHMALNVLVGTAQISCGFRERLLGEDRPAVLAEFDLTNEERGVLLAIEANSVKEFAVQLEEWLQTQESSSAPWDQANVVTVCDSSWGVADRSDSR